MDKKFALSRLLFCLLSISLGGASCIVWVVGIVLHSQGVSLRSGDWEVFSLAIILSGLGAALSFVVWATLMLLATRKKTPDFPEYIQRY